MTRHGYEANDYRMTIHPHLGIGWQTTADQVLQQVTMQLRLFCLRLPFKRRIQYSLFANVSVVSRVSWWNPPTERFESFMQNPEKTATEMPTEGWRHDILMALKGGKTAKIETVTSIHTAREMEQRLRHRLGLPEVH